MAQVSELIQARATDLQARLAQLDARYADERAAIVAELIALKQAATLITPEIQTAIDKLGVTIVLGK